MNKWTPGPWRLSVGGTYSNTVEAQSGRSNYEFDDGYRAVASFQCCESTGLYKEEEANRIANGRLIAAAPEMFDALVVAESYLEAVCFNTSSTKKRNNYADALSIIRSAIEKAKGE